jgi:hypothetical protein
MKNISLLFLVLIASTILLLDSCKKEDNTPPDTTTDVRDKYTGTWHCIETVNKKDTSKFDVTINKDANNSAQILLNNFYNLGVGNYVTGIVADPKVNIPSKKISTFTVSGDGTYVSSTKMTWNYKVNDGANTTSYYADFTK